MKQLSDRIYREPTLYTTIRLIGWEGIEPTAFFDAAKRYLKTDHAKTHGVTLSHMQNAMYDVTRADKRSASPAAYHLSG